MGRKERGEGIYSLSKLLGLVRKSTGCHWLHLAALQARKPMGVRASLWSTIVDTSRRWRPSTGLLGG